MTIRASTLRRLLSTLLAVALAVLTASALGQGRPTGLPAVINVGSSDLDASAVKGAVEHELGVPLSIDPTASERLEIVVTGRRANVTYYAPPREPVTRSVDLPKDRERGLETIAFLAGNLARDEASELLRELAPPAADTSVPPPPPPPATSPAPAATAKKPPPVAVEPPPEKLLESKHFAANVSLYYPLTGLKHTERWRLNLELGVAYSRVGAIHGAGMSLGYLRVDQSVDGFIAALGWARAGAVRGFEAGLFVAEGYGSLRGIGYGTFANFRSGNVQGLQASVIFASATDVLGIEGAGVVVLGRDIQGFQGSAGVSVARDVRGAQLGAVAAARDARGVQAGVVAVGRDVTGLQVGIVNVGHRVNGLQLGLVNVADEIDGGAIGLVSIARNGRFQPTVWFGGPGAMLMGGYKSITGFTYTQAGIGYDLASAHYGWELGTGVHLGLPLGFYGETGFAYDQSHDAKSDHEVRQEVRYDLRVGFEPVHGITPFVGGSLSRKVAGGGADFRGAYAFGIAFL